MCACYANGHATRGRVLVRGRTARIGRWASTIEHASVEFSSPIPYPRSRAFPARSAHRPVCIKTADLADRWARGRVDTNDENRALRDLRTHKPPAISKPAQTASFLSRGEAPEA